jgi:hypothetical protein
LILQYVAKYKLSAEVNFNFAHNFEKFRKTLRNLLENCFHTFFEQWQHHHRPHVQPQLSLWAWYLMLLCSCWCPVSKTSVGVVLIYVAVQVLVASLHEAGGRGT